MTQADTLTDRYIAVWNEADPARRRERIEALWAPGGATTHRLLEARGYDAIGRRVAGANETWVRDGGFAFRVGEVLAHNEVVRLVWEMVRPETGEVDTRALSHLVLDREGRILCDYQFAMRAAEADANHQAQAEAYIGFWNETDPAARAEQGRRLWSATGGHADIHGVQRGMREVLAEADRVVEAFAARGRRFRLDGPADGHHGALRFDWAAEDRGRVVAHGHALLLLDGDDLIDRAYTFDDPRVTALAA